MEKKEMLKDAIKNFGGYTQKQNEVLGALIDIAVDGIVSIKPDILCELTSMKRSTVYFALNTFQKDGLIVRDAQKQGAFKFQQKKIDNFIKMQNNINKLKTNKS